MRRSLDSTQITASAPAIPASSSESLVRDPAWHQRHTETPQRAEVTLARALVVYHHDTRASGQQLLDGLHYHRLDPADDHVTAPLAVFGRPRRRPTLPAPGSSER